MTKGPPPFAQLPAPRIEVTGVKYPVSPVKPSFPLRLVMPSESGTDNALSQPKLPKKVAASLDYKLERIKGLFESDKFQESGVKGREFLLNLGIIAASIEELLERNKQEYALARIEELLPLARIKSAFNYAMGNKLELLKLDHKSANPLKQIHLNLKTFFDKKPDWAKAE